MPSLGNTPVDLILEILNGACLEDILNVTRTSSFLRSIGSSSRSLWINARDADRLPLPIGETLETVPIASMSKLAASAVALSAALRGPVAHPLKASSFLPPPPLQFPPNFLYNPLDVTFLFGNQWLLIKMEIELYIYHPESGAFASLCSGVSILAFTSESGSDGSSVTVAALKAIPEHGELENDHTIFLDVYVLQFDDQQRFRALPSVTKAQSIRVQPSVKGRWFIELKGPLVFASSDDELFIANWQERSGVMLSPQPTSISGEEEQEIFTQIIDMKVYLDSSTALFMVAAQSGESIHVDRHSVVLTPFQEYDPTDKGLKWTTQSVSSTCIQVLDPQQELRYMGFRSCNKEPPVLEIISQRLWDAGTPPFYHLSISELDEVTPEAACRKVDSFKLWVEEARTASGRTICLGTRRINSILSLLFFLRMPDVSHDEFTLVSLELPEGVHLGGFRVFDDVYGTLIFVDNLGNFWVVQY